MLFQTFAFFYLAMLEHVQSGGGFEPRCTGANDYGWPRFKNLEELESSRWKDYFLQVYGELPSEYPVCIYDFWMINEWAYTKAGLLPTRPVSNSSVVKEGDLYRLLGQLSIYHSDWKPVPNNTWVEVTHSVYPTELVGAWVWTTRGSGIWYNVGRTKVFPTPANPARIHEEAIAFLSDGCSVNISGNWPQLESDIFGLCAREKGYDSIQFEPQQGQNPMGSFGLTGLTEMVLVKSDGNKNCAVDNPADTPLRSGWNGSSVCVCGTEPIADSCGLMPTPPFPYNIFGEEPRLCKLREESLKKTCTESTCHYWHCKLD